MTKRQILLVIVSAAMLIIAVIGGIVTNGFGLMKKKQSPLLALPDNVMVYYYGEDISNTFDNMRSKLFWENITSYPTVSGFNKQLKMIDSLLKSHEEAYRYVNNNKVVLSLHKTGNNKVDVLFIIPAANRFDADRIKSMVHKPKGSKFIDYNFRNHTIFSLQQNETDIKLAFSFCGGLLIISKSSVLVEDAIRSYYEHVNPVKKIMSKNKVRQFDEKFYINFNEFSSLPGILLNPDGILHTRDLRNFASFAAFNINMTDNEMLMRGNLLFSDTATAFVNLFEKQTAGKIDIAKVASIKTAVIMVNYVSDFSEYFNKLRRKQDIDEIENRTKTKIKEEVVPRINGQFAITLTEPVHGELLNSTCVWIKTDEPNDMINIFKSKNEDRNTVTVSDRVFFPTNKGDLLGLLFGDIYNLPAMSWFTMIKDYMVFSPELSLLQSVTSDFINEQTLSSSSEYVKITEKISSESNFLLYINPLKALNIPELYLNEKWLARYKAQNFLLSLGPMAFQMTNNINTMYGELIVQHNMVKAHTLQKIWEYELDTIGICKPFMVINHNNNKPELLLMDAQNKLYLISADGQLIWKKEIGSRLVGNIYMIDFFNNKKYQFLFATETHLHCIDRLGRNVGNYPIRLGATAATGIFLYKPLRGNLKYFIGTNNQAVYGYDISGKPLNGWNLKKVDDNLAFMPGSVVAASREFFYALTKKGTIYVWDSKGNPVVNALATSATFKNPFYSHSGIDFEDTYLISADTNGNTWKIFLNKKKEVTQLAKWSSGVWYHFLDINHDKKQEQFYIDHSTVAIYEQEGKITSSFKIEVISDVLPDFYEMNDEFFFTVYSFTEAQLYFYNVNGIAVRNFPVQCSAFYGFYDLNLDKELDLAAVYANKIFVARY